MAGRIDNPGSGDAFDAPEGLPASTSGWAKAREAEVSLAFDGGRGALPPRIREIVAVVVLAFRGDPTVGDRMRRALAAGASVREIAEALMSVATPGGQACLANGIRALDAIVRELGDAALWPPAASVKARTGREVSPASPWPWLDRAHPEYQAIRRELNDLTFMPEGAALDPKYREIVVACVLCCRHYPTVPQHLRRAVAEGATLGELFEAVNVTGLLAGQSALHHAIPFLTKIHDEIEAGTLKP